MRFALFFAMGLMLFGCSANEVIRIGTPIENGKADAVEFHTEISDKEKINQVRNIYDNLKEVDKPKNLKTHADTIFILDKPKDSVTEIWASIWHLENDKAIVYTEGDKYYSIPKEQTGTLKTILN